MKIGRLMGKAQKYMKEVAPTVITEMVKEK